MAYVTPKQFLASKNVKVNVGDILNPTNLGMDPHPQYGTLPTVEVTKAEGGRFVEGIAACLDCETQVVIHAGDWFQKRRCEKCQRRNQRKTANPPQSEEAKAAKVAEREAKKAATAVKKAEEKAQKNAEKAKMALAKAEEKAEKLRQEALAKFTQLTSGTKAAQVG